MRRKVAKCSWERFLDNDNENLDPQDKISRLPKTVMQHIVSFLSPQDKDQVRFLSKKWRRIHAQSQEKLSLTGRRLDAQQFTRTLVDDFPSVEILVLRKCLGMKQLRIVNYKLKSIEFCYCGSLKNLELTTPNLCSFRFLGPRLHPCRIELGICKQLRVIHLVGVAMNNMMFSDCKTNFPVLESLLLSGCDATGCIHISSNSLDRVYLLRFKELVDIAIDAPNLLDFDYSGSVIASFSQMNLPDLASVRIELDTPRYQKRDASWFHRLIEMLKGLKHTRMLMFESNSDKNIIIPKELRETLAPPLDDLDYLMALIKERSRDGVDLVDGMLWICPRVHSMVLDIDEIIDLQLVHGETTVAQPCEFCSSHPIRCWRHSLTDCDVNQPLSRSRKKLMSYLTENLQKVKRDGLVSVGYEFD